VAKTDGYATGDLSSLTVNDAGELVIGYSNGQSQKLGTVALASFSDQQSLTQMGNGLFDASHASAPRYVASQGAGVGQLLSSSSEASNVDLSTEFGRLILIQRGFQASSQVITTANEMIVELFQMRGGQG
jgi:flagellar hook protein FlgE